jgi:uncharacterized protein YndB with AHSA1/START domain
VTDIELDQFIAREPAAVWRALTEPELLATRLFLRHAGFAEGSASLQGMGNGWPALLRRIEPALAEGRP